MEGADGRKAAQQNQNTLEELKQGIPSTAKVNTVGGGIIIKSCW